MSPRRLKLGLVFSSAGLSAVTLLAWTQQWFTITLGDGQELVITGETAAPGLSALALAGLVLVAALSIAGPVFRLVLGSLQLLIGIAVVFSSLLATTDPVGASTAVVSEVTGVAGVESVAALVSGTFVTAWPWLAMVVGACFVAIGAAILVTARRWPGSSRKYQAVRVEPVGSDRTSVEDWDALTSGSDPT